MIRQFGYPTYCKKYSLLTRRSKHSSRNCTSPKPASLCSTEEIVVVSTMNPEILSAWWAWNLVNCSTSCINYRRSYIKCTFLAFSLSTLNCCTVFYWCTCWHPKQTIRHKEQSRSIETHPPDHPEMIAFYFFCVWFSAFRPPHTGLSLFSLCLGIPLPNATTNISYSCAGALLAHTFSSMHVCSADGKC